MIALRTHVTLLCIMVATCLAVPLAQASLYDAPGGRIQSQTNYEGVAQDVFDALLANRPEVDASFALFETYSHFGEPIVCKMPRISFSEEGKDELGVDASAASVPSFLMPLKSKCMRHLDGWWTYEFCFGKHLRQFHITPQGKVDGEYVLGRITDPKLGITVLEELEANDAALIKNLEDKKVDLNEDLDYYSERYGHGTACDLSTVQVERSVEIRWSCAPGAQASTIRSIKEPASCQYILEIESPLLCQHPAYASNEAPIHTINCFFVRQDMPVPTANANTDKPTASAASTTTEGQETLNAEGVNAPVATTTKDAISSTPATTSITESETTADNPERLFFVNRELGLVLSNADSESDVESMQTTEILRMTIRSKVKNKLAIVPVGTVSYEDDQAHVLNEVQLERLLGSMDDAQLLLLLTTVDEAIEIAKEEAEHSPDTAADDDDLIVLEWDDVEMMDYIFGTSSETSQPKDSTQSEQHHADSNSNQKERKAAQ